jgi:hypothetical protein
LTKLQKSIFELHLRGFTGKLTLSEGQLQKTVYFRKGNPIYVSSTVRSEMLGQILLREGKLTEEQFTKVLEVMDQTKKRQGEVIVELGFMTACQVYEALKEQAERKFENCLLMENPEVRMDRGEEHLEGVPDLTIDMFRVFMDLSALHGVDEEEVEIQLDRAPYVTPAGAEYLRNHALRPNESRALRLFDGTRSLETILSDPAVDTSVAEVLAHSLHALGFLELKDPLPQRFSRPASQVVSGKAAEPTPAETEREVVTIDPKEPPCTKDLPIYAWALRLDRPMTELLNVGVTTTKVQIRKTYENLIRDLHLDAIGQNYVEKDRKIAEDVFSRLTLAYTILSDDKRRHEYVNDLAQRKPPKDPTKGVSAEVHIQKAKILLTKKQFAAAEKEINSAIELMPEESAYLVALADLQMHKATVEKTPIPPSVEQIFKKALALNATDLTALFQYGLYAKLTSDFEKAKSLFSKILEIAPNHQQTLSELRLVNQRLEAKKKPSILNIFKKK